MEKRKGIIQVYTGDGKGKTSAGLGQAVRARAYKFKVCFVTFFKDPEVFLPAEGKMLKKLGVKVLSFVVQHPAFYSDLTREKLRGECLEALKIIKGIISRDEFDLLVLDEINIALRDGFLEERELLEFLQTRPEQLEIILTGRGATAELMKKADLVTVMKKIKHPFDRGEKAQPGRDY